MLFTITVLLLFQCLGEAIVLFLRLPIPGPVMGMVLLFLALILAPKLLDKVEQSGTELLRHLSLLFVPVAAGIMVSVADIGPHWLALLLAMMGSTLLTLAVTAASMRFFSAKQTSGEEPHA
jgi:putative effector of murein hydrolase LrgA (UPF0299 family)